MPGLEPGFQPRLRLGLRFESGSEPSIVSVVDTTGKQHQMYEIECLIAREMDGTRDLDDLTRIARRLMPSIRRDQMEKLVRQLAGMGLLSNLALGSQSGVFVDDLKEDDEFGTDDTGLVEEPSDSSWEAVEPLPDLDNAPPPRPASPAIEQPQQEWRPEQSPQQWRPEQPQQEWRPQETRWYQKPALRRFRLPLALALTLAAATLIEYPLYVTEESLVLSGERFRVRAQVDGLLHEILADEGDLVKEGEVIARLDERDTTTALEQAKAGVARLTANLEKQRRGARPEELATARAALAAVMRDRRFAKREVDRKTKLFEEGVTSAEQRDQAMRDFEMKRSETAQAEAELRLVQAGSRKEEVAMAEAELQRAKLEVRHLEQRKALLTIVSPVNGQITTPRFKERLHEHVARGDLICEIVDARSMDVEVYVPEREIDSIAIGQAVVVKVASYPLQPFEGKVAFIAPAVAEFRGERAIRVLTKIENPQGMLREGMSGYGEINAGKRSLLALAFRRAIRWVRVRFLV